MTYFDVFNGDADGLCSLRQLRLATPRVAVRITGIKRDVALLQRVPAVAGDSVTVLDVSMETNRDALLSLLGRGVAVQYFDHHDAGDIPSHPLLQTVLDPSPSTCTGILVDRYLGGAWRKWAIAAAFGDNFGQEARVLADSLSLPAGDVATLQEVGECVNYNAYGDSESDLIIHPEALYALLERHADPLQFAAAEPVFRQLRDARESDLASARQVRPHATLAGGTIYVLPDAGWSRRVRGDFGNILTRSNPEQAHAILTVNQQGGYTISVRAPLSERRNADQLCKLFPTGGGRPAAAGINHLPASELDAFVAAFAGVYGPNGKA